MGKKGIDVSYHQGNIDFSKVKNEVEFVILREGYGLTSTDKKFDEYVAGCKSNGIPILGVYHFSYAKTDKDPEKEAVQAVNRVKKAGLGDDTIIFYDLEYDSVDRAAKYGVNIDKKVCRKYTEKFCTKVEELGYKAGIYCNVDFYKNMYEPVDFENRVFWLADYGKGEARFDCDIRQYSSSGIITGIAGKVDVNELMKDFKMSDPSEQKKVICKGAPRSKDENLAGQYKTTANLYLRDDAGTSAKKLCLMPKGTTATCDGYYTQLTNKWMLLTTLVDGVAYAGFASVKYLSKV